eukprot:TRINITY_DN2866_c0_g1_i1.p1 TRINITY_DN2866_c0_g1~~TRINITY_DN2866_c0_g1_i1.p1  ORF type:complete len:605 (+),score=127.06 TRINITY_DN2866_c0_g1_i1:63-1817(+)
MSEATDVLWDVIVVGGGLSGLTTAYRLASRYKDNVKKVLLLEASEDNKYEGYAGGRTRSYKFNVNGEHWVSIGGTWLIFEDWLALQLADEVSVMPTADTPKFLENAPVKIALYPWLLIDLWLKGWAMVKDNPTDWWSTKTAQKYDKIPLEDWLNSRKLATANMKAAVREYFWAFENFPVKTPALDVPVNISTAFAAYCLYNRLHNITPTGIILPKLFRWEDGTGAFVNGIKKKLADSKVDVLYEQKVQTIDDSHGDNIVVSTVQGAQYKTKYVVVAGSPIEAGKIAYNPPLPDDAVQFSKSILPINMISLQVLLGWDNTWWYTDGVGPQTLPDYRDVDNFKFYAEAFEVTGHIGKPPSQRGPGMMRFLCDPRVDGVKEILASSKSHAEKAQEIGKIAATWWSQYFKTPELKKKALNFTSADFFNFQDLPAMPGTGYYYPTNVFSKYGQALRRSHGKVFFAGTERAVWGVQWMEGAIHRGNEIAAQVAKEFNSSISVEKELDHWKDLAEEVVRRIRWGEIFTKANNNIQEATPRRLPLALHESVPEHVEDTLFAMKVKAKIAERLPHIKAEEAASKTRLMTATDA